MRHKSKQKPIDLAWKVFATWVKNRDTDWRGYGNCFTCETKLKVPSGQAHAGHFVHGKYKKTYFLESNVHLQCRSCNYFKDGARDVYALKLIEKYGDGIIQQIHSFNKQHEWKKGELEDIIKQYEISDTRSPDN